MNWWLRTARHFIIVFSSELQIKRLEELLDWRLFRKAVRTHDLHVPLALWAALVLVETHKLGVIVMNLALAHGYNRAHTRLVTRIVVQANLAQGRHGTHLVFKRLMSLNALVSKKLNDVTTCAKRPSSHVNYTNRLEVSGAAQSRVRLTNRKDV